jgi:hypothetical protein
VVAAGVFFTVSVSVGLSMLFTMGGLILCSVILGQGGPAGQKEQAS